MGPVGKIISAPLKLVGLVKSPKAPPGAVRSVFRDDARAEADRNDELRKRRGGAADIIGGMWGGEAGAGGKTTLGG